MILNDDDINKNSCLECDKCEVESVYPICLLEKCYKELPFSEFYKTFDLTEEITDAQFIDLICCASSLEQVVFSFERNKLDLMEYIFDILIRNKDTLGVYETIRRHCGVI